MARMNETRRRPRADAPTSPEDPPPPLPAPTEPPPRSGTGMTPRRAPPQRVAPQASSAPRLDPDDLMALAQMSPEELAALMEGATVGRRNLDPGTKVAGPVTRIGRDVVFVDIGGKSEGQIDRSEVPEVKVGDTVTSFVVDEDENGVVLSMSLSGQAASDHLEEARVSGLPVEGKVASRNTGGFEVRIGSVRAFCPVSLMSRIPEVDLDAYVGQTLQFRVVETGEKTVVNRRILQEEEAEAKAGAMWATLAVGQQHRGIVRSVQPFGMFVDIGGVDGLVPKREISWRVVDDPRTAARVGQAVEVVILEMDNERKRLTLSAKALEEDPWSSVDVAFHEGGTYRGVVVGQEAFGAFVELAPGLAGLVHVSKLAGATLSIGDALDVRLLSIDRDRKRLELAPVREGEAPTVVEGEQRVRGTVSDVMKNGVVVQLDDGRTGWLPESEVELPQGTVLAQRFRRGKSLEARILKEDAKRPTLSLRAAMNEEEQSWRVHQAQTRTGTGNRGGKGGGGSGFGTLGDLLGSALGGKDAKK